MTDSFDTKTITTMALPGFDSAVFFTTDHPASSYGVPVLLIDGEPYGVADISPAGDCIRIMLDDWIMRCELGLITAPDYVIDAVRFWIGHEVST
jgi:hypothetical protein